MDSLVSLRYPNGRVHEATLSTNAELVVGDQFDLYGRRWEAVGQIKARYEPHAPHRMLCSSTAEPVIRET